MRMLRRNISLFFLVLLVVHSICFAEGKKTEHKIVPDSFTLRGCAFWGVGPIPGTEAPQIEVAADFQLSFREGKLNCSVGKDKPGYKYLKEHNAKLNIAEVYPESKNPYGMPKVKMNTCRSIRSIEHLMGEDLIKELIRVRKIQIGEKGEKSIVEPITFAAIKFVKQGDDFDVSAWLPDFLLPTFMK